MTRRKILLSILAMAWLGAAPAPAAEGDDKAEKILVVVHASNDVKSVDAAKVKNYYLGTLGFWENGQRVTVFQRSDTEAAGKRFFADVMRMAPSRYRHHWQTQQLSGQGVEPELVSGAAGVVAKVAGKAGGIGYILESERAAAEGAKVRVLSID